MSLLMKYEELKIKYIELQQKYYKLLSLIDEEFWEDVENICS